MRDPKRIAPFMARLQKLWEKYSDLRFGQFILNGLAEIQEAKGSDLTNDLFYVEDEEFFKRFEDAYNRFSKS